MKKIREARKYTVHARDEQCSESCEITIPAGPEDEQDIAAWSEAEKFAAEWIRGGDWGDHGAIVSARYWWVDAEYNTEDTQRCIDVEIDPDHGALIRAACGDGCDGRRERCCGFYPDDHDWTSHGDCGLDENPGVWSHGGTTITHREHCAVCGLIRTTTSYGSQRNPGQADEVEYVMPE